MDENYRLSIMPDAESAAKKLITTTGQIQTVDASNAATAKTLLETLGTIERYTEKTRAELKGRPLEIGRRIDACAKSFLAPLVAEKQRIRLMVEVHAAEVAEAALAARQEQARLAREAEAELQRIQREELARLAAASVARVSAELAAIAARVAAAAADAPDGDVAADIAAASAYDAAEYARASLAEITRQNAAAAAQDRANAACAASEAERARIAASQKVAGASQYWDYELVNDRALVRYCHDTGLDLVEITLCRQEILSALKAFPIDGNPPVIPGLLVVRKVRLR
jgi:hypothetical protein